MKKFFVIFGVISATIGCNQSDVVNCKTEKRIEFLGGRPAKSDIYVIGTCHYYTDPFKKIGYVYDNAGLILQAFQKIHTIRGDASVMSLYTEGVSVGSYVVNPELEKIIPRCVMSMGYTMALGIDARDSVRHGIEIEEEFNRIFREYCNVKQEAGGRLNGNLKKPLPQQTVTWLLEVWYPMVVMQDITLERSILSIKSGVVLCGIRHAIRMGWAGKIDWAIVAVNDGLVQLEKSDFVSQNIVAERYVCEGILKLPFLP